MISIHKRDEERLRKQLKEEYGIHIEALIWQSDQDNMQADGYMVFNKGLPKPETFGPTKESVIKECTWNGDMNPEAFWEYLQNNGYQIRRVKMSISQIDD